MPLQDKKVHLNKAVAILADQLKAGDVVLLFGKLGAGKTFFIKKLCKSMGILSDVTSPTYTITQEYSNETIAILHSDLYRLQTLDLDLLPEIYQEDKISIIEWGERIPAHILELFRNRIEIHFNALVFSENQVLDLLA